MPLTTLKLEKSKEYHQKRDRYETKRANRRFAITTTLIVTAVIIGMLDTEIRGRVLFGFAAMFTVALIRLILVWFGARVELFGEWLVNKTKR